MCAVQYALSVFYIWHWRKDWIMSFRVRLVSLALSVTLRSIRYYQLPQLSGRTCDDVSGQAVDEGRFFQAVWPPVHLLLSAFIRINPTAWRGTCNSKSIALLINNLSYYPATKKATTHQYMHWEIVNMSFSRMYCEKNTASWRWVPDPQIPFIPGYWYPYREGILGGESSPPRPVDQVECICPIVVIIVIPDILCSFYERTVRIVGGIVRRQ